MFLQDNHFNLRGRRLERAAVAEQCKYRTFTKKTVVSIMFKTWLVFRITWLWLKNTLSHC